MHDAGAEAVSGNFEYLPGEMEAWSKYLKNKDKHAEFSFQCSHGHTIESPVELNPGQVDQRCMLCDEEGFMNREDAWTEARKRWGDKAYLSDRYWRPEPEQRFMVTNRDKVYGIGATWEDAFARAERTS